MVISQFAGENGLTHSEFPTNNGDFHSYVSLPEGTLDVCFSYMLKTLVTPAFPAKMGLHKPRGSACHWGWPWQGTQGPLGGPPDDQTKTRKKVGAFQKRMELPDNVSSSKNGDRRWRNHQLSKITLWIPLVISHSHWKWQFIYSGFHIKTLWFSITMLNCQRVCLIGWFEGSETFMMRW